MDWMVGVKDRGLGRTTYEVCTINGQPVEKNLENVSIMAGSHLMLQALEAHEAYCNAEPEDQETAFNHFCRLKYKALEFIQKLRDKETQKQ